MSFAESLDGYIGPKEHLGHQQQAEQLKFLTPEDYASELLRRGSQSKDNITFIYCLVFPAKPPKDSLQKQAMNVFRSARRITEAEIDDQRNEILKMITDAGFVVELVSSSTDNQILCKIGCNDQRFLKEAENKEYKLEIDPKAVQHVLELKVTSLFEGATVSKPKHPVFLGYKYYNADTFEKIQHLGGAEALPLFLKNGFDPLNAENDKITLDTAKRTFLEQSSADPFNHLHFKYDVDWEERIIKEHKVQLYRTYNDGTILRTADRISLCLSALQSEAVSVNGIKGAGLDLKKLQFKKKILAFYPIQFSKQTRLAGDLTADELFDRFMTKITIPFTKVSFKAFIPWSQPIQDIRDYAGEKIAYYFAFLEFYSFWLLPTALAGLIIYVVQIGRLNSQTGSSNIVTNAVKVVNLTLTDFPEFVGKNASEISLEEIDEFVHNQKFTTNRTLFAVSNDGLHVLYNLVPTEIPLLIPLYSLAIALWAAFFLEFWKRHQASLAYRWGVSDYERSAEVRPEFVSEYDVPDAVTGLPTPYRSPLIFGLKIGLSISFVFSAVAMTIAAFSATYIFKAFMSQSDAIDPTVATQLALVLNSVAIMVLAIAFKTVAKKLTNWENHRTDIEYEDMLIGKSFVFSFFNSYTTLLYFAFFKKGQNLPPAEQTQYCIADLQFHDEDNFKPGEANQGELYNDESLINVDSCYGALGYSLMIIFITQIFISNAIEIGGPLGKKFMQDYFNFKAIKEKTQEFGEEKIMKNVKNVAEGMKDAVQNVTGYHDNEEKAEDPDLLKKKSRKLKSPAEVQFLLGPYETPFDDYLELALQFGYVTLFVAAFPLAPTLALLNNCVEVWVDSKKVCMLSRRPNIPRAQDIGTWLYIFTILSYIAIATNAGVLVFTSVEIVPLDASEPENKVWAFLGFIVGVFSIKYFTDFFISDVPKKIAIQLERQKFIEQKIFYDDEDDSDKFIILSESKVVNDTDQTEEVFRKFKVLEADPYLMEIVEEFKVKLKKLDKFNPDELFEKLDRNKNGEIKLTELRNLLLSDEIGFGKQMDPFAVKLVMDALDENADGKITKEEIRQFLSADDDNGLVGLSL